MVPMKCPRCKANMKYVRGVAVCVSCGGAFVACTAVDTVRLAFDDHAQSMAALATEHASTRAKVDTAARVPCPSCAREMSKFLVGPVEVDTCLEHGSWYDRGELVAVRDALRAGAPTAEVTRAAPATPVAPAPAPLELARPLQKSKPSTPRPMDGGIDAGANAAIQRLIKSEHAEARRARNRASLWDGATRRHSHDWGHGSDHSALEVVEDVLDILSTFD